MSPAIVTYAGSMALLFDAKQIRNWPKLVHVGGCEILVLHGYYKLLGYFIIINVDLEVFNFIIYRYFTFYCSLVNLTSIKATLYVFTSH